jgi:hypothetical protein
VIIIAYTSTSTTSTRTPGKKYETVTVTSPKEEVETTTSGQKPEVKTTTSQSQQSHGPIKLAPGSSGGSTTSTRTSTQQAGGQVQQQTPTSSEKISERQPQKTTAQRLGLDGSERRERLARQVFRNVPNQRNITKTNKEPSPSTTRPQSTDINKNRTDDNKSVTTVTTSEKKFSEIEEGQFPLSKKVVSIFPENPSLPMRFVRGAATVITNIPDIGINIIKNISRRTKEDLTMPKGTMGRLSTASLYRERRKTKEQIIYMKEHPVETAVEIGGSLAAGYVIAKITQPKVTQSVEIEKVYPKKDQTFIEGKVVTKAKTLVGEKDLGVAEFKAVSKSAPTKIKGVSKTQTYSQIVVNEKEAYVGKGVGVTSKKDGITSSAGITKVSNVATGKVSYTASKSISKEIGKTKVFSVGKTVTDGVGGFNVQFSKIIRPGSEYSGNNVVTELTSVVKNLGSKPSVPKVPSIVPSLPKVSSEPKSSKPETTSTTKTKETSPMSGFTVKSSGVIKLVPSNLDQNYVEVKLSPAKKTVIISQPKKETVKEASRGIKLVPTSLRESYLSTSQGSILSKMSASSKASASSSAQRTQVKKAIRERVRTPYPKLADSARKISISRPKITISKIRTNTSYSQPKSRPSTFGLPGYNVLVRKQGKWMYASRDSYSKREALRLGAKITSGTAAASFRLVKSGKSASTRGAGFPFIASRYRRPVRGSKLGSDVYIERNPFRINTPGEVREISYKGVAAVRRGGGIMPRKKKRSKK